MPLTYLTCDEATHAYHVLVAVIEGERRSCLHPGIYESVLSGCLERPQVHFKGYTPYPDIFSKAAALLECIISSNVFLEGGKRMGFLLCALFLERNGYCIDPKAPIVQLVLAVAKGEKDIPAIAQWLRAYTVKRRTDVML